MIHLRGFFQSFNLLPQRFAAFGKGTFLHIFFGKHPAAITNAPSQTGRLCRSIALLGACAFAFFLSGCSAKQETAHISPFALEGPPLAIVGEYNGIALEGVMDRHVMVGIGKMELRSVDKSAGLFCEGRINAQPTDKARVRGILDCTEGKVFFLTLRNLGPDQGLGVGHINERDGLLMLFYHTSQEEAERRFPEIKEGLLQAQRIQQKQ